MYCVEAAVQTECVALYTQSVLHREITLGSNVSDIPEECRAVPPLACNSAKTSARIATSFWPHPSVAELVCPSWKKPSNENCDAPASISTVRHDPCDDSSPLHPF